MEGGAVNLFVLYGYDRRYQVAQSLCRVTLSNGRVYDVYATGARGWVLFRGVSGFIRAKDGTRSGYGGWFNGTEFPVERKRLKRHIARLIPRVA